MTLANSSGVYMITNQCTGKFYVGSACNLRKRWNQHRSDLRNGVHANKYLQRSVNNYGLEVFIFEVLCLCARKDLIYFEQWCIWLKPVYNLRTLATSMLGYKHTEQSRLNMSKAHMGKPNNWKGRKHSNDTRQRMRVVHKLKGNGLTGIPKSEASKQKIAFALLGNRNVSRKRSEEARKRVSEGRLRAKLAREAL